ncbi:MAG: NADH-quinone oxidoreductase subunit J [Candidatus Hydrogenedentes bacterium]|nr:NADH-quinone oxidoreductase subunit J [Candidatus Hydrogenedentota bacterium]
MNAVFYISAGVAVLATVMVIVAKNAIHGLLSLLVSLLAVSLIFYVMGAPFIAALEIIIYGGAIMVLFIFVVMLLNLGPAMVDQERQWLPARIWIGPGILALVLVVEMGYVIVRRPNAGISGSVVTPQEVGLALFGLYLLGVELASMLLLVGLVGAYYLGQRRIPPEKGPVAQRGRLP